MAAPDGAALDGRDAACRVALRNPPTGALRTKTLAPRNLAGPRRMSLLRADISYLGWPGSSVTENVSMAVWMRVRAFFSKPNL